MTSPEEMLRDAIKSAADAAVELRTAYVFNTAQLGRANARIAELEKEVEALRTERDTLRTALQPFADIPEADVATIPASLISPGRIFARRRWRSIPLTQNGEA